MPLIGLLQLFRKNLALTVRVVARLNGRLQVLFIRCLKFLGEILWLQIGVCYRRLSAR